MAINFFTYAGVSSRTLNLYITGNNVHGGPERGVEHVAVPGRDGDLLIDGGRWGNYKLTLPCFCKATRRDIPAYIREIKTWLLRPAAYMPLELSYTPDYFRMAAVFGPMEIDTSIPGFGKFDLIFDCKPFQYLKKGQHPQDVTAARKIINPESFESLPYIKIIGSGDVQFSVGNRSWNFAGVDEWIEIDSDIMNVYKGAVPQNNKKTGDGYPTFTPGVNNMAWTENVTKVEVIPRWRTL